MGGCLSKKESTSTDSPSAVAKNPLPDPPSKPPNNKFEEEKKKNAATTTTTAAAAAQAEESVKKKEVFVIKQRRSHERRPSEDKIKNFIITPSKVVDEPSQSSASGDAVVVVNGGGGGGGNGSILVGGGGAPVRTSSCTKEEVDAILIQCGRLSRSSSGNRKYSGSKRSYDFDHDSIEKGDDAAAVNGSRENRHHHHSRSSHRRTPSREKDVDSSKRSGSRDRYSSSREEERGARSNGGSGSRRVSRSPGRRSETPSSATSTADKSRPGKMVSVPASVATTRGDKSAAAAGGDSGMTAGVKRVSVKRSGEVGHRTTAASPRSQSPANVRASNNENNNAHHQNQPGGHSLSRNSSKKAEHSPYRRNPMAEIDDNCQKNETLKSQDHKVPQKIKETEQGLTKKPSQHLQSHQKSDGRHNRVTELAHVTNNIVEDHPIEEAKGGLSQKASRVVAGGGGATESLKPQGITRTRSSRRSRDLDLNLGLESDTLLNPTSYASLLLEDIQNFHQQNTTPATATAVPAAPTAFSLPACVTKACSILDAVADLNSCASSNLSSTFSNEDRSCFETDRSSNNNKNFNRSTNVVSFNPLGKKRMEVKDPFVESELVVDDDLMEPSLHKYITVRRGVNIMTGGGGEKEMEQQESSGSNSYVGGQHWASSSSSWEPNSADSTDRWTSRSNTAGEEEPSLQVSEKQQQTISATPIRRKREATDHRRQVVGGRGQMTIPIAAASM
ncbi:hypothetical protein BVC80_645g87 [Macleaya cordata]|uniref:Uncharacterized protein n=1 Tax=Macleaya cordata TaxID=56857 RepID=A0A200QJU6_MACCD|nr:hypothetical protein BVC80_645g87 [Macleaya cordata]